MYHSRGNWMQGIWDPIVVLTTKFFCKSKTVLQMKFVGCLGGSVSYASALVSGHDSRVLG